MIKTNRFLRYHTFIFLLLLPVLGYSTHNRAGEITYEQIDDLTIRATITTYTRTSSFAADRDSLELFWGDGTSIFVARSNGNGEELPNDIKVNYYIAEHTYPTRSQYTLSVTDPNRIAGIQNIDFPNSVNIQFYIETTLTLLDQRFQGPNSSAVLLQPPIDFACVDQTFIHNPNAYDPDGDSLAYELITPFQEEGVEVPNYNLPDEIRPGDDNIVSLDPVTGEFVWESPKVQGEFNITILIKEYREGILINEIIRDMQILVISCIDEDLMPNSPPTIEAPDEICVIAGELVEFDVLATDNDSTQLILLSGLGGPFELDNQPAGFDVGEGVGLSPFTGKFTWQTNCSHVAKEYYQVVFKATDDFLGLGGGAATLKTVRIKVTAPAPEDVVVEKFDSETIRISWQSPYPCEDDDLFQGFSVWRKLGTDQVAIDSCQGGLIGYEEIIFLTNDKEGDRYVAYDDNISANNIYCYRVLGEFAQLTESGNPFNKSESIASNEDCARYDRRAPLITQVSVTNTSNNQGTINLTWTLPDPDDIDTIANEGPFSIRIERSIADLNSFVFLDDATFFATSFSGLSNAISYQDDALNTQNEQYSYRISFWAGDTQISTSSRATSIRAEAIGRDHSVDLSWSEEVPWLNYSYLIYEVNNSDTTQIDSITNRSYEINNLSNGVEYCYLIESIGTYGLDEVIDPIFNYSQTVCVVPTDSIAPCAPEIEVKTICSQNTINPDQDLFNEIIWNYNGSCLDPIDTRSINIYYSSTTDGSPELVGSADLSDQFYDHVLDDNIAGCYWVSAIDSSGNESSLRGPICVDNCPSYILPNAFTPNGDNSNDTYKPIVNRFVEEIDMEVFNRWGQKVFTTTDPDINWDGHNSNGSKLSDGTYYYKCKVFEKRVTGIIEQSEPLSGYIQIITGQ